MLKLRYQCLENLFSLKNLFSTLSNTAFPTSMASAVTRAKNLHQQQILWKNPLAQGLQVRFLPRGRPCFVHLVSFIMLQVISSSFGNAELVAEKKVIEMSKRKRNPPYLNDIFSQLEEWEIWQGLQISVWVLSC